MSARAIHRLVLAGRRRWPLERTRYERIPLAASGAEEFLVCLVANVVANRDVNLPILN